MKDLTLAWSKLASQRQYAVYLYLSLGVKAMLVVRPIREHLASGVLFRPVSLLFVTLVSFPALALVSFAV